MTKEELFAFFEEGYAGFYGAEGNYSDVVIDGHYDLCALEANIALAISKAIEETYEECAQIVDGYNDALGIAGEKGEIMPIAPVLGQAIRSRSKGEE